MDGGVIVGEFRGDDVRLGLMVVMLNSDDDDGGEDDDGG